MRNTRRLAAVVIGAMLLAGLGWVSVGTAQDGKGKNQGKKTAKGSAVAAQAAQLKAAPVQFKMAGGKKGVFQPVTPPPTGISPATLYSGIKLVEKSEYRQI